MNAATLTDIVPLLLTAFGFVVSVLLSVLVWIGNRLVRQFDALTITVTSHGNILARFDTRLEHIEVSMERRKAPREFV